jgi:hypothetical protein
MQSFNNLLAEYLLLYGRWVRENPDGDMDGRSVMYEMQGLADIVEAEDFAGLLERLEELKADIALV